MFRSILAWTLTAATLVTLPVTGAGYCPCRLVAGLRGPTPTPSADPPARAAAPPKSCKGCCHAPQDHTPADAGEPRTESPQPPDRPAEPPCDHRFAFDAAPAGASGERPGDGHGTWDSDAAFGAAALAHARPPHEPAASSDPSATARTGSHVFRYAHAFRC